MKHITNNYVEFITYGVGVSLMQMRDPKKARGRAPVAAEGERHKQAA